MADFQWEERHLDRCLEKLKNDARELSARDIQKKYSPKKGKPIENEQTINSQDYRNLMRLMVMNGYARVTMSDIFNPILKNYESGQRIPPALFTPIHKIFKPSDELSYRCHAGDQWLEVLSKSDNPEIKKAVQEVKVAFLDIANYHLTRYNRTRLK